MTAGNPQIVALERRAAIASAHLAQAARSGDRALFRARIADVLAIGRQIAAALERERLTILEGRTAALLTARPKPTAPASLRINSNK